VMKLLLPRVAGRAPGDQVSAAVRQVLQEIKQSIGFIEN